MGNVAYVFGDESGNLDFSNNQGASRYFLLTTVMMENCSVGDALLQLRRGLAWKDVLLTETVSWHRLGKKSGTRSLNPSRLLISVWTQRFWKNEKPLNGTDTTCKSSADLLGGFILNMLGKRFIGMTKASGCSVVGRTKEKTSFLRCVCRSAYGVSRRLPHPFWHDATDPCLQVADYCGWVIQRKWNPLLGNPYVMS